VQRGGQLDYNSYSWLGAIESEERVPHDASPKSVAERIWKKARTTFDPIECFYFHTKEGQRQIEYDGPVMFVVAGYANGSQSAEVYAVRVQYDRQNSKLVYPPPEKIFQMARKSFRSFLPQGIKRGLTRLKKAVSLSFRSFAVSTPKD